MIIIVFVKLSKDLEHLCAWSNILNCKLVDTFLASSTREILSIAIHSHSIPYVRHSSVLVRMRSFCGQFSREQTICLVYACFSLMNRKTFSSIDPKMSFVFRSVGFKILFVNSQKMRATSQPSVSTTWKVRRSDE